MPSITVRNLDSELKDRLRAQAARHGCSMAQEARNILEAALPEPPPKPPQNLVQAIRDLVEPYGGFELELPPRWGSIQQLAAEPEPADTPQEGLGTAIHNRFKPLGGVELELPPRCCCRLDQGSQDGCSGH